MKTVWYLVIIIASGGLSWGSPCWSRACALATGVSSTPQKRRAFPAAARGICKSAVAPLFVNPVKAPSLAGGRHGRGCGGGSGAIGLLAAARQSARRPSYSLVMSSASKAEYRTLSAPHTYEEVIKKSRFIARSTPATTFDQAQSFLRSVSDPKASHNCWAWRGSSGEERCSDDGEPSGTAGRPMLGAIEAEGLKDVMVVITRYFGGIKLGSGGLVRAYAGVTRQCLREAPVEVRSPAVSLRIKAPLSFAGGVYNALGPKAERLGEVYEEDRFVLRVRVPMEAVAGLERAVQDATRGAGTVEPDESEGGS